MALIYKIKDDVAYSVAVPDKPNSKKFLSQLTSIAIDTKFKFN
jgi:hypothetical protein